MLAFIVILHDFIYIIFALQCIGVLNYIKGNIFLDALNCSYE